MYWLLLEQEVPFCPLIPPSCHRMPWRPQGLLLRPIRIGVLRDDGVVRPVSPIARAIEHVVRALRRSPAFEVVEYEPFKSKESWETVVSQAGFFPRYLCS
jgi:Asp-tRNA(Asn)/Glu-tRNA(Gln) amidotransferase A subunit family amidase